MIQLRDLDSLRQEAKDEDSREGPNQRPGPVDPESVPAIPPDITAGPRLRAGFVLVPDIGDSAYTMNP